MDCGILLFSRVFFKINIDSSRTPNKKCEYRMYMELLIFITCNYFINTACHFINARFNFHFTITQRVTFVFFNKIFNHQYEANFSINWTAFYVLYTTHNELYRIIPEIQVPKLLSCMLEIKSTPTAWLHSKKCSIVINKFYVVVSTLPN